jgi:RNA polymerase-binding transcription factor DksA
MKRESKMESHIKSSHPEYKELRKKLNSLLKKVEKRKLRSYTEVAREFGSEIKEFERFNLKRDFTLHVLKPQLKKIGLTAGQFGECKECGSELIYLGPWSGILKCDSCGALTYNRSLDYIAQLA